MNDTTGDGGPRISPMASVFVDLHHHAGPDILRRRRTTREAGRLYRDLDAWVVVKSHLMATTGSAYEARQEGLPVSGSVVLNAIAGGLSTRVVESAVAAHGVDPPARTVVYLPTVTGHGVHARSPRELFHPNLSRLLDGLAICDVNGLTREARDVIACCADTPVVLATGHSTRDEVMRVVERAADVGVGRLVVTHATHPIVGLSIQDLRQLATVPHVYVELTGLTYILRRRDPQNLLDAIGAHPRVLLSSDLGQPATPDVGEWLSFTRAWLRAAGVSEADLDDLLVARPARLLAV